MNNITLLKKRRKNTFISILVLGVFFIYIIFQISILTKQLEDPIDVIKAGIQSLTLLGAFLIGFLIMWLCVKMQFRGLLCKARKSYTFK